MLALLLAAQLAAAPTPSTSPRPIEILGARMAGCWEMIAPNGRTVEQWIRPEGGLMLGLGRSVRDGQVREYEFLLIQEKPGGLDYIARPSGQAEATFALKSFAESEVVFENLAHDFPQRVVYRWNGPDAMTGRIEGGSGDQARAVDFAYKRCPTGN